MKKWCLMVLAALCLLIPTVGSAQGLPDFLQAVQTGLSEGLSAGSAAMEKDLTLSVTASDARVEAGRDVTLTIRAENPRPAETRVALTLSGWRRRRTRRWRGKRRSRRRRWMKRARSCRR